MNAPAAQRRRLGVAHKTVTVPTAGPAPGISPGPDIAPSPLFVPGPVPDLSPGPTFAPSPPFAPAPAGQQYEEGDDTSSLFELLRPIILETGNGGDYGLGQQPQEGGDDDSAFQGLLDPALFNTAGLTGDDSAAMQTFLDENQWAEEPMEEGEPMEED